ncbi:unnamed protein product, partial [Didymodactylos carnosus]
MGRTISPSTVTIRQENLRQIPSKTKYFSKRSLPKSLMTKKRLLIIVAGIGGAVAVVAVVVSIAVIYGRS